MPGFTPRFVQPTVESLPALTLHSARPRPATDASVQAAINKAQAYLLSKQFSEGYWWAELEANVTLTAEYVFLHKILSTDGDRTRQFEKIRTYLRRQQRQHGGWELYYGDGGELSTSIEAYFALKLLGDSPDLPHMARARQFILERGGVTKARVFTKIHLALFGAFPWEGCPTLPPWIMLLPDWFPFTIYELASWARSSTVPLLLVADKKPVVRVPGGDADELYAEGRAQADLSLPNPDGPLSLGGVFIGFDRMLKLLERFDLSPRKAEALALAERWTIEHQDDSGDWGGIIPAMLNSLLGLHCRGYAPTHPVMQKGLEAVERFCIETEDEFHTQPCVSPVWDTGLTILALLDSGMPNDHPALVRAGQWLLSKQILRDGDWRFKNKTGPAGGWAFEFWNDFFPDVDDTAVVTMALHRLKLPDEAEKQRRLKLATEWTLSMQSGDGGWGAFDVDNNLEILNAIPYGDLKAMIDPPTADLTGHILEMLGSTGYPASQEKVERAIAFIKSKQEPEGCWWGRWGVNYIYGTHMVICGLVALGLDPRETFIMRGTQWLNSCQNEDGGWGETCASYGDRALMGVGKSTPSQTAWALLGLMAGGEGKSDCVRRGIEYLVTRQNDDGSWTEAEFTGTGFPNHFYMNYHFYRNYFPLMALGRYRAFAKP
ncbi:MAG: squalene--hopene cyclase [Acidobacteriota bacterium]